MDISLISLEHHFHELFTAAGLSALLTIIIIDIVMSGDNAIVIGMATKDLPPTQRKKAIMLGVVLATVVRIIFASIVTILMSIVGIKIAGGILLLYVVWKFYKELRISQHNGESSTKSKGQTTLLNAIYLIIIADVSMSLDNVLAVAGAAKENILALGIGLVVSIILMAVASNFIANKLEKYPQIQWLGLLVILYVSVEMIINGGIDVTKQVNLPIDFSKNIMPIMIFGIGVLGFILHAKYIKPVEEAKIKTFLSDNYTLFIIINLCIILVMGLWGGNISGFLFSHTAILYTFIFIVIFILIELFSIHKARKQQKK